MAGDMHADGRELVLALDAFAVGRVDAVPTLALDVSGTGDLVRAVLAAEAAEEREGAAQMLVAYVCRMAGVPTPRVRVLDAAPLCDEAFACEPTERLGSPRIHHRYRPWFGGCGTRIVAPAGILSAVAHVLAHRLGADGAGGCVAMRRQLFERLCAAASLAAEPLVVGARTYQQREEQVRGRSGEILA